MALVFYFNIIVGVIIVFITPGSPTDPTSYDYWLIIAHPISRLPVFLMGIFAGVLCTRIQEGDTSALNSMIDYTEWRSLANLSCVGVFSELRLGREFDPRPGTFSQFPLMSRRILGC